MTAVVKMDAAVFLDLHFHFLDLDDHPCAQAFGGARLDAAAAPTAAFFQNDFLGELRTVFAGGGLALGTSTFDDVENHPDLDGLDVEHAGSLLALGSYDSGINVFFVRTLSPVGLQAFGPNPGPAGIAGTTQSGIIIGIDTLCYRSWTQLARLTAHEIARYMGLYHNVELEVGQHPSWRRSDRRQRRREHEPDVLLGDRRHRAVGRAARDPHEERGAPVRLVGALAVVAFSLALPASGDTTLQLTQPVIDTLTPIDSLPSSQQINAVFDDDPVAALAGLQQIANPPGSVDRGVQLRAIRALVHYCVTTPCGAADPAHVTLLEIATDPRYRDSRTGTDLLILRAAIESLGVLQVPGDVDTLGQQLQHPSRDIRAAVAKALRDLGNTQAIPPYAPGTTSRPPPR